MGRVTYYAFHYALNVVKEQNKERRHRERMMQSELNRRQRESDSMFRRKMKEDERFEREKAREKARIARELARIDKRKAQLQKQKEFEAEVQSIILENEKWNSLHKSVSPLLTENDFIKAIRDTEVEKEDVHCIGLFDVPIPEKNDYKEIVSAEAESKFPLIKLEQDLAYKNNARQRLTFNLVEPTSHDIALKLTEEANKIIKSFWPWTKKRKVREYVQEHISLRYDEEHKAWRRAQNAYYEKVNAINKEIKQLETCLNEENAKKNEFIKNTIEELYNQDLSSWKCNRASFYENYISNLHELLSGESSIIENSLDGCFSNEDLPMLFLLIIVTKSLTEV